MLRTGPRDVPREKKIQVRPSAGGSSPVRPASPLGFRGRLCTSQRSRHAATHVDVSPGRVGRIPSASKSQPNWNSLGSKTATGGSEPAAFQAGQTVLYCPREAGVQKATVLGRVDARGWQIQLENGLCRMVEDAEEWRLCLCDLPQPPRPPQAEGPVLAWAEAPMGKVLSTSSTVSSLATALTGSTAATEAIEAPRSGPKVSKSSFTIWTSPSPMRPAQRASPGGMLGGTGASVPSLRPLRALRSEEPTQ